MSAGVMAASSVVAAPSTLSAAIAAKNPSYWWKLGEAAGASVAVDSGSVGVNGAYTAANLGYASLDASDPASTSMLVWGGGMRTAAALPIGVPGIDEVTMIALYRPIEVDDNLCSICGIEGSSTFEGNAFQMRHDNTGLVALVGGTGSSGYAAWTEAGQLAADTTYMVALRRTAVVAQLYKNGVQIGTDHFVSNDLAANDRFGIGVRGSDGGRGTHAYIQHVAVFINQSIDPGHILNFAQKAGLA